jgi:hypothetical protein
VIVAARQEGGVTPTMQSDKGTTGGMSDNKRYQLQSVCVCVAGSGPGAGYMSDYVISHDYNNVFI